MSDTLNNKFLISISHLSRDLAKSHIHQNLNKIKKEVDEKLNEENNKNKEKIDNILSIKGQHKLTESLDIEKQNLNSILKDLNLSYVIDNLNDNKKKNIISFNQSLNQITNNEFENSNLIIEDEIRSNDSISSKKNKNDMMVEIFYSPHSFIENSLGKENIKKKKSFYEKEMYRQKYIKNK